MDIKQSQFIDFLIFKILWISIVIFITILCPIMTPPYMTSSLYVVTFKDNEGSILPDFFNFGSFGSSPVSYLSGSYSSPTTTSHKSIRFAKMISISTHKFRIHISECFRQLMGTIVLNSF